VSKVLNFEDGASAFVRNASDDQQATGNRREKEGTIQIKKIRERTSRVPWNHMGLEAMTQESQKEGHSTCGGV